LNGSGCCSFSGKDATALIAASVLEAGGESSVERFFDAVIIEGMRVDGGGIVGFTVAGCVGALILG